MHVQFKKQRTLGLPIKLVDIHLISSIIHVFYARSCHEQQTTNSEIKPISHSLIRPLWGKIAIHLFLLVERDELSKRRFT